VFHANTTKQDRRRLTKEHLERRTVALTETLHKIAEDIPLRPPERITKRKSKKKKTVRAGQETLRKTAQKTGTLRSRRNAWSKMLQEHKHHMAQIVKEEKNKWAEETKNIETDLKEGDWAALWKINRSRKEKKADNMPKSYTDEDGKHIWKRDQVMEHIRKEAHAIAEPEDRPPTRKRTRSSNK
jgi:hypothetical protein